ncbi:putative tubulin-specific chaperone [Xylona heveae TC161]|uniref:Putative tubulin-specific chaperone n=1 Tax=Xylona heveae (strain CBS 132557 / TC161) TaxID=1328760 RepID=A0A165JM06_XYLHT|nr:putative tubulin-specific chaperone [Xylona heveae TC161]KZF26408.1 putative tubulin-specific chaperone [Xylona heveae TC161]
MDADFHLGQRLSFDGALCTVRYTGEVKGTSGRWLGVEWDDVGRGKHSGEHGGIRYFECKSKHSTAGSFVRPTRPVDKPLSFLEALQKKYVSEEITKNGNKYGNAALSSEDQIKISGKVVEEVGFDKIRQQLAQLNELRIVLLDGLNISGILLNGRYGEPEERERMVRLISETCPKIVELDLSRNLLEHWQDVADICRALPMLRSLRVNGNRFGVLRACEGADQLSTLPNLQGLALDNTLLSWDEVCDLTEQCPSLTTLSASSNRLDSLLRTLQGSCKVSKIILESNNFSSLSAVGGALSLPGLERLHLRDNSINRILDVGQNVETTLPLSISLSNLDVSYNAIDQWSFLDGLDGAFPNISSLRMTHNPVYLTGNVSTGKEMSVEEAFMLTVARVGRLKTLNFSVISAQDRSNAELYYLSRIAKVLAEVPQEDERHIVKDHPRYGELCDVYGPPTIVRKAPSAIDPHSLEARLIRITFYSRTPISHHADPTKPENYVRQIPRGFNVYKLIGIVVRLFNVRPFDVRLIWETGEWDPVAKRRDDNEDSESEDEAEHASANGDRTRNNPEDATESGKWIQREVELEAGTREIGFWIEGREAKIRVELK